MPTPDGSLPHPALTSGRLDAAVDNIVDVYLRPEPGQLVYVLHDDDKSGLAAAIAAGLAARGRVPALLAVPAEASDLDAMLAPVFARDDVALVALISRRMWLDLGLARHFDMVDGVPSLLARCRPAFADWVLPLDSVLRVYGSDVAADAAHLRLLVTSLPANAPMRLTTAGGTDLRFVGRDWRLYE